MGIGPKENDGRSPTMFTVGGKHETHVCSVFILCLERITLGSLCGLYESLTPQMSIGLPESHWLHSFDFSPLCVFKNGSESGFIVPSV